MDPLAKQTRYIRRPGKESEGSGDPRQGLTHASLAAMDLKHFTNSPPRLYHPQTCPQHIPSLLPPPNLQTHPR